MEMKKSHNIPLTRFNDEKWAKAVQEHETRYDPRLISSEDTYRARRGARLQHAISI